MQNSSKNFKAWIKWIVGCLFIIFVLILLIVNLVFPLKYNKEVKKFCNLYDVSPQLVYSVIWTESKFDTNAVSSAGAVGLMQLMPSTAKWCCQMLLIEFDPDKLALPEYNIMLGTFYLSYLIKKYGENDAVIAYNAGEGNMLDWNGSITFSETKNYVKRVKLVKKIYIFKLKNS